ncbi:tubulin-like doman-containing protein [Paraburkholderia caribensis]|nr:tubulin-like doman-containing protein [Paraburkholderia caribensis]
MARNTGIDPMRGRPTPGIASTEEKIQRRKLDSLKRGIHRIDDASEVPYSIHLIGVGGAGTSIVAEALKGLSPETLTAKDARLNALGIDIGDSAGLDSMREQGQRLSSDHGNVQTLQLDLPSSEDVLESLTHYPDFLKLEYPLSQGASTFKPWLDDKFSMPAKGEALPRAIAKAIYGRAYYDGDRPAQRAIRRFTDGVSATPGDSLVCICFGLGGGTGSGIAVDLARHVSNVRFGRRILVVGIGIAPCDGDRSEHAGASLFNVLNEFDCMGDETKNRGVVAACGDLYGNPFTAGFLLVPQQHVWEATGDLKATHARIDEEVASLITLRNGANLWETLRLLNWVAAPSTQHSAARTQYGMRWIHVFGFADVKGTKLGVKANLPKKMGLLPTYRPEFIEARVSDKIDDKMKDAAQQLGSVFGSSIPTEVAGGGRPGSVQFILPQVTKTDLQGFSSARDLYDSLNYAQKLMGHSWLLERGVMLCEPSTTLKGMAGASLGADGNWVAVPYEALRGEEEAHPQVAAAAS